MSSCRSSLLIFIFISLLLLAPLYFGKIQQEKDYCPVNQIVTGPLITGWFSYPLNLYDSALLRDYTIPKTILNCTSIELNEQVDFTKFHSCSDVKTCPVHKQNLIDAMKRSKNWTSSYYLCPFSANVNDHSKAVNIIVLGGSVTSGQFTEGYYCDNRYDSRCAYRHRRLLIDHTNWARYIEAWFKLQKMTHVKVHFLAVHGYSSAMMNEVIVDKLYAAGLRRLSSSDIVLIDHSFNDGLYLVKIKELPLQIGLEGIVRKVLGLSESPISYPSIVIIETLPYLPDFIPFWQDYQILYTKVARHYRIPIWSLRDAVNAEYTAINQTEYFHYMRHDKKVRYDLHPGWHVHLLYADIIAALFKRSHHNCMKDRNQMSIHVQNKLYLPPPIIQNANRSCAVDKPYLLDISAEKVMKNQSTVGTWSVSPELDFVWKLRDEGRGRVGWVQEKGHELTAFNGTASITFYPEDPHKLFGTSGDKPHLIQIQFMRTYKNAGQVRIWVCGNLIVNGDGMVKRGDRLDALWGSYESYKYSLPEIEYVIFPDFGMKCREPGIRLEYVKDIGCLEKNVRRYNRDPNEEECQKEAEARTLLQKFKLISIKICSLANS